jgi:predicted HTH domain antitoxin
MSIIIDVPTHVEQDLRAGWEDLEGAAKAALLSESYRAAKISLGCLAAAMGMGVIETQAWLSDRGIPLNYSHDDLQSDRQTLSRLFDMDL